MERDPRRSDLTIVVSPRAQEAVCWSILAWMLAVGGCSRTERSTKTEATESESKSTASTKTPPPGTSPSSASSSSGAASSASVDVAVPGRCRATPAPFDSLGEVRWVTDGMGVAMGPDGTARVTVRTSLDATWVDIPAKAESMPGWTPVATHVDAHAVPILVGNELGLFGMFGGAPDGSAISFELGKVRLSTSHRKASEDSYNSGLVYPKRLASASHGDRWMGVVMGLRLDCGMGLLDAEKLTCQGQGPPVPIELRDANGPFLLITWKADETLKTLRLRVNDDGEARADSVTMVGDADAALITFRSLGAIRTIRVGWDGVPKAATEDGKNPKVIAGGDVGSPSTALAPDGTLHLVWGQRTKPKGPFALRTNTFKPATDFVTTPVALKSEAGNSATSPIVVAVPGGFALAWLDVDELSTRLFVGKGPSIAEAAAKAVAVRRVDGSAKDLAFGYRDNRGVAAFSVPGKGTTDHSKVRFARIACE